MGEGAAITPLANEIVFLCVSVGVVSKFRQLSLIHQQSWQPSFSVLDSPVPIWQKRMIEKHQWPVGNVSSLPFPWPSTILKENGQ